NEGLDFERAKVGDRYVFERLQSRGGNIGGESSGHILCLDRATTGDGIVTALQVLGAIMQQRQTLQELVAPVRKCPQALINVPIRRGHAERLLADAGVTA